MYKSSCHDVRHLPPKTHLPFMATCEITLPASTSGRGHHNNQKNCQARTRQPARAHVSCEQRHSPVPHNPQPWESVGLRHSQILHTSTITVAAVGAALSRPRLIPSPTTCRPQRLSYFLSQIPSPLCICNNTAMKRSKRCVVLVTRLFFRHDDRIIV